MAILDLISQVHLPSSVNMLPKYLKQVHKKKKQVNNEWNATLMEMKVFIKRSAKTSNFTIYLLFQ